MNNARRFRRRAASRAADDATYISFYAAYSISVDTLATCHIGYSHHTTAAEDTMTTDKRGMILTRAAIEALFSC